MHCNGKCYLAKKLKEQEKQDQQASNSKREKFEMQSFFLPNDFGFSNVQFSTIPKYYITYNIRILTFPRSVFHPPSA